MKTTQELLKNCSRKVQIYKPRYLLDRSSICRDLLELDRCLVDRAYEISDYSQQCFILKGFLFMGLYNPYWTRKAQGLCKPIWNRRAIKLLFKEGGKRKT